MQTLLEKFNVLKSYTNANTQIEFDFNKSGFSESLSAQSVRNKSMADFAKMLSVMDSVVENAIPVESHTDKYVGAKYKDSTLNRVYVFLSALQDDSGITPVQLEVKEFNDAKSRTLYLAVTMDKIKAEVSGADQLSAHKAVSVQAPRSATFSIPEIISKINPSDGAFLKYIPDSMLSDAQKAAKQSALEAQQKKIDGMKPNPINQTAAAETQRTEENAAKTQREAQSKAKPDGISTYRASGQAVTPNSAQPTGTPRRSPAQIAKRLADDLKTGYSVGTRKIRQMPAEVQGISENRARQIAVRSKKAGSYVVTMHEAFHGLGERLGMAGNQQMINNLDPTFAQAYTAAELPGEAFAEFGWRYMQSDELARSFAGDAYVDAFEGAIRREGVA